MDRCPYCGYVAVTQADEVEHMNMEHPEVIRERLLDAGFVKDEQGHWIDTLAADDS